jgi:hypothetical protein
MHTYTIRRCFTLFVFFGSSQLLGQNFDASFKEIAGLRVEDKVEASRLAFAEQDTRAAIFKFTPQKGVVTDVQDYLMSVNSKGLVDFIEIHRAGSSETYFLDWIEPSHEETVLFFIRHLPNIKNAYTESTPRPDPNLGLGFRNPTNPTYSIAEVRAMLTGIKNGPFVSSSFKDESPVLRGLLAKANGRFLEARGFSELKIADEKAQAWRSDMKRFFEDANKSQSATSGSETNRPEFIRSQFVPSTQDGEQADFFKKK